MDRSKYSQILGYLIILVSLAVISGWLFDIQWLKQPFPFWISMKFITAVSFLLSGITLVIIAKSTVKDSNVDFPQTILPILSLWIMLIMAASFLPMIIGFNFGIENMLVEEMHLEVYSTGLGLPSVATTINFMLISLVGLLHILNFTSKKIWLLLIGVVVTLVGGLALIGYVLNIPLLFYYIPGKSSAIAITTASLFILWGLGIVICYGDGYDAK